MGKVATLLLIFTVSTTIVTMLKYNDYVRIECPRCGVVYELQRSTVDKRKIKGSDFNCRDCYEYKPRKSKMTPDEVWEAYKKDKGL